MHATLLDPAAELPRVRGFGELTSAALTELAPLVAQRHLSAHAVVATQGEPSPGLVLLVRGAAKVVRVVETGEGEATHVLDVLRAATVVPDPSAFDGLPSDASLVALRASHLFVIERASLLRVMAAHPTLAQALLWRFVRSARSHAQRVDELVSGPVEERIRRLLDGLAARHGTPLGNGRFIALPLRRRDLASMVNATPETVSRLLARLERDGEARSTRDGIWWRTSEPLPAPTPPPSTSLAHARTRKP